MFPFINNAQKIAPFQVDLQLLEKEGTHDVSSSIEQVIQHIMPKEFWSSSLESNNKSNNNGSIINTSCLNIQRLSALAASNKSCNSNEAVFLVQSKNRTITSTQQHQTEEEATVPIPNKILVHVYNEEKSPATERVTTRKRNMMIKCHLAATMSNSKQEEGSDTDSNHVVLAPTMFGQFENGYIEEHLDEEVTFHKEAKRMAQLHLQTSELIKISGPSRIQQSGGILLPKTGDIWYTMRQWLKELNITTDSTEKPSQATTTTETVVPPLQKLTKELVWLESALTGCLLDSQTSIQNQKHPPKDHSSSMSSKRVLVDDCDETAKCLAQTISRQVVFCQMMEPFYAKQEVSASSSYNTENDGQHSYFYQHNFYHAGYNPMAIDIANTWCCLYDDETYPSEEEQMVFLREYLSDTHPEMLQRLHTETKKESLFFHYLKQQINRYACVSHLYWCLWSLKLQKDDAMARNNNDNSRNKNQDPIKDEHQEQLKRYATTRFQLYQTFKYQYFFSKTNKRQKMMERNPNVVSPSLSHDHSSGPMDHYNHSYYGFLSYTQVP